MFERQPVEGYLATCEAIAAFDRRADAKSIVCPVAVLVGSQDGATPPDVVAEFARTIAGANFTIIEGAGHLPCIEEPGHVADAISGLVNSIR